MNVKLKQSFLFFLFSIFICTFFTSCFSYKKYAYFNDAMLDSAKTQVVIKESNYLLKIQPDDRLSIDVLSANPQAAAPFNLNNITTISGYNDNAVEAIPLQNPTSNASIGNTAGNGYLVDRQGYIRFPVIGMVYVEDMTVPQLQDTLTHILRSKYLNDATVNIKIANAGVLVMGEVTHVSRIGLDKDKTSVLDALAAAGDISRFGNRSNVLLIREKNGVKTINHLDLTKTNIMASPDYYLQQNDIVYVYPRKDVGLAYDNATSRILSYVSYVVSFVSLIIAISK
ncbi:MULTISPECIES: polysaccharide biosynthesis/export family protein [Chitinophagaceae]